MKLSVFSAHSYDKQVFRPASASFDVEVIFHEFSLSESTVTNAQGCSAVCVFVNDIVTSAVLEGLKAIGVRYILLRCAGYNNVDLDAAERLGILVANVPSYSPHSVAEYAVTLIQTLNRKTHHAYNRVREGNFSLDGLLGFQLHGKTVGVIGIGQIGIAFCKIMNGFGCRVLAYDPYPNENLKGYGEYVELDSLLQQSDIISLHCPLLDSTKYIIDAAALAKMKQGAMLVNTSRGGLVHTKDVIQALKKGTLGGLALDVYEAEGSIFYGDHSAEIIDDDVLMRLTTFRNVIVSGHQAFLTNEAIEEIAKVTLQNLQELTLGQGCMNRLRAHRSSSFMSIK